jgi:hypothetical protein
MKVDYTTIAIEKEDLCRMKKDIRVRIANLTGEILESREIFGLLLTLALISDDLNIQFAWDVERDRRGKK